MQPQGKARELFEAFSRLNNFAYADTRLLANHVLSKAPHCNDILERFLRGEAPRRFSRLEVAKQVVKCWVVNIGAWFLLLGERIAQARAGLRVLPKVTAMRDSLTVVDIFTLVHRINMEGKFRDYYLPGLYEVLEERGHNCVILARMYGSRDPRVLRQTFEILREHPQPVLTENELMTFADWLRLLWFAISFPLAVLRITALLANDGAEGQIKAALLACLPDCYLSGECRRLAGRRLAEILPQSARIISWYENQVVDKCFYRGLAEGGSLVRTYAAQFLTWPPTLLNNHADPADAKHKAAPAFVAVNGPYFIPRPLASLPGAQQEHGSAAEASGAATAPAPPPGTISGPDAETGPAPRYFPYVPGPAYGVGPALRYKPVFERELAPDPDGPALFLLSYHPDETRRCLAMAKPLAEAGVPTAFKFHPATNVEDFRDLLPADARLVKGALNEALEGVSLVIGAGSGALCEAVAMGVPAINVEPVEGLGLNYLPDYGQGQLWDRATSAAELLAAREKLLDNARKGDNKRIEAIRTFRGLVFGEPTVDSIVRTFDL